MTSVQVASCRIGREVLTSKDRWAKESEAKQGRAHGTQYMVNKTASTHAAYRAYCVKPRAVVPEPNHALAACLFSSCWLPSALQHSLPCHIHRAFPDRPMHPPASYPSQTYSSATQHSLSSTSSSQSRKSRSLPLHLRLRLNSMFPACHAVRESGSEDSSRADDIVPVGSPCIASTHGTSLRAARAPLNQTLRPACTLRSCRPRRRCRAWLPGSAT
jgi:hypothetical protein